MLMIAGNHDCWGGEVLREDVGIDYHVGHGRARSRGWRARIEHGDGLRPREDRRYRVLRRVLRNPLAIRAFRWLHPDLRSASRRGARTRAGRYGARDRGRGLRARRGGALERATRRSSCWCSVIPTSRRWSACRRSGVYANAGSWLDAPTYLRVTTERIALRQWNGSAEGLHLDTARSRPRESADLAAGTCRGSSDAMKR